MSTAPRLSTLYLVPTPLDFGVNTDSPIAQHLPDSTLQVAAGLRHWITENAKSTRAFLKRVQTSHGLADTLQALNIQELPRHAHKKGDHSPEGDDAAQLRSLLAPACGGHDMGLVSEAGMPAVADPGGSVVRAAHRLGIRVVPLQGSVSLMLALAASGLNGQDFAFVGYVPQDAGSRSQRIQALEALALKSGQTQLMIETPYRNAALLGALIQTLKGETRLAVACDMGLPTSETLSASVREWKAHPSWSQRIGNDRPAVFMLGR